MDDAGAKLGDLEAHDDMARAGSPPLDAAKIEAYVRRLRAAANDQLAFRQIYEALQHDMSLKAQDVIAIAQLFAGGAAPKSRKAAITAVGQERVRVSHAATKSASAAKNKAW